MGALADLLRRALCMGAPGPDARTLAQRKRALERELRAAGKTRAEAKCIVAQEFNRPGGRGRRAASPHDARTTGGE